MLRLFPTFREVVERTGDIVPTLIGTVMLVFAGVHVYTYFGMILFGGLISPGQTLDIEEYYDLNNFNSYHEGLVTMYQVLVINDWHAIAAVFLGISDSLVVYTFFISANLITVSIFLNVMVSFFVGAFSLDEASKSNKGDVTNEETTDTMMVESEAKLDLPNGERNERELANGHLPLQSQISIEILQREGRFDHLLKSMIGQDDSDMNNATARICEALTLFESLQSQTPDVGFMVSCQQSLARYGNSIFANLFNYFVSENEMHTVLTDIQNQSK